MTEINPIKKSYEPTVNKTSRISHDQKSNTGIKTGVVGSHGRNYRAGHPSQSTDRSYCILKTSSGHYSHNQVTSQFATATGAYLVELFIIELLLLSTVWKAFTHGTFCSILNIGFISVVYWIGLDFSASFQLDQKWFIDESLIVGGSWLI